MSEISAIWKHIFLFNNWSNRTGRKRTNRHCRYVKRRRYIKSERRATISMEIEKSTPYSGFGYIVAGQHQDDINAINISNLEAKGTQTQRINILKKEHEWVE